MENIDQIVTGYIKKFPDERADLAQLIQQIFAGDNLNNRKTMPGHVTGSALVLSPNRDKVLMVHHKFLDKWLQPGGHWEATDPNPQAVAQREAIEETGVSIDGVMPVFADNPQIPLDINTHHIPANPGKGEPAHLHHDFRYVFLARNDALTRQVEEVNEACFMDLTDTRTKTIENLIAKLRQFDLVEG